MEEKNKLEKVQLTDRIELRSEEVQEILSRPPKWIIRWGTTIIFVVIAGIVVGSWFFKYPDIISASIRLTTENPPAPVLAKTSGKIQNLFVNDNDIVKEGELIGIIENPANYENVAKIVRYLNWFKDEFRPGNQINLPEETLDLGNIQSYYANFSKYLDDYLHSG